MYLGPKIECLRELDMKPAQCGCSSRSNYALKWRSRYLASSVLHKSRLLALALVCFCSVMGYAAIDYRDLPKTRFVEWKRADIQFPDTSWITVDVTTLGIRPGSTLGDSIAKKFVAELSRKGSRGVVYYFPEGTYTFEAPICIGPRGFKSNWNVTGADVNDVVIKGAGPKKTRFRFDCDVSYFKALIWVEKPVGYTARNSTTPLAIIPEVGSSQLSLPSGSPRVAVGDLVEIKSDNDPELMFPPQDSQSAWYRRYFDPADTAVCEERLCEECRVCPYHPWSRHDRVRPQCSGHLFEFFLFACLRRGRGWIWCLHPESLIRHYRRE